MGKAVLILDEINLLLNSEEPKNTKLYGNLYEVLLQMRELKAITLDELKKYNLDKVAQAALTYNKTTLMDNVKDEWFVESNSSEDISKKVKCGLCNTPNKYLFFIRNRKNHIRLNVGSYCMTKFPGIEGYTEYKYHLNKVIKNQQAVERRTEFHNKHPNVIEIIDSANYYFDNLPILLPYDLYHNLKDAVTNLRLIYSQYVSYGKKPFKSNKNSFDLFSEMIELYNGLKKLSDSFVLHNNDIPFICKRDEIDWMIENKQWKLLDEIAQNNGLYTEITIAKITSLKFIKQYFPEFVKHNKSQIAQYIENENDNSQLKFSLSKFGYQFQFIISVKKFMRDIGAKCIFDNSFSYNEYDMFKVSEIAFTNRNLQNALDSISDIMDKFGYAFLFDDDTNDIYVYKKSDKAVKLYSDKDFLKTFSVYFIINSYDVYRAIALLTSKNWILREEQAKKGIDDKVSNLYYRQHIEPYE